MFLEVMCLEHGLEATFVVVMITMISDALMNWGRFMRTVMFRYYRIRHPGHRSGKDFLGEISFMIEHSSESSDDRDHDFFIDDVKRSC